MFTWGSKIVLVLKPVCALKYKGVSSFLNAWKLFKEIEANGGWLNAVQSNFIQDRIEKNAAKQQHFFESKNTHLLGTNLFPNLEEKMTSEVELSIQKNMMIGKDFKALNSNRLSTQIDLDRLKKEGNHA